MAEAILVIDMLNDFVDGKLKCERAYDIIPNINELAKHANKNKIHVMSVGDAHYQSDYELKKWGEHAMKGTYGAKLIDNIKPKNISYEIEKRTYSGFYETGLDSLLRSLDVNKVYLTGLHTNLCARHTAADAFFRGFEMVGVKDGLNAYTEKDHKEGLEYLNFAYNAEIKTVDEIIDDWGGDKNVRPPQT